MSEAPQPLIAGRYRLVRPLGQGGMGRVWLARDARLRRDVAVKELVTPSGLPDEERHKLHERLIREARAIARLDQANVVRVFDAFYSGNEPWIVMEFVSSRSLSDVLATDGPMRADRAARIGLAVLGALRAAHRAGLLHRDIKPANVLLGDDGRVVLTDFGLAMAIDDPSMTQTGIVMGSPAYLAPERATGVHVGPESDVWSLGATLYEAVEGQPPYCRSTTIATLAALATEPPRPPQQAGALSAALEGMLRRDPAERIDINEAERLLRQVVNGGHPPPSTWPVLSTGQARHRVATARNARQARRIWLATALVAVLSVVAAMLLPPLLADGVTADPDSSGRGGGQQAELPAGWHWYQDSPGYAVPVPDGWQPARSTGHVEFGEPAGGRQLTFDELGKLDIELLALASLRAKKDQDSGQYPSYQQLRIGRVDYHARAVEREWIFTRPGGDRWRAIQRSVTHANGKSYLISWSTKSALWSDSLRLLSVVLDGFRPLPEVAGVSGRPIPGPSKTATGPSSRLSQGRALINVGTGKCVDVPGAADTALPMHIWDCLEVPGERFFVGDDNTFKVVDRCLEIAGVDPGATVRLAVCTGAPAQQFLLRNGALFSVEAKRCLAVADANPTNGTPIVLGDCGGPGQEWRLGQF